MENAIYLIGCIFLILVVPALLLVILIVCEKALPELKYGIVFAVSLTISCMWITAILNLIP